MRNNVEWLPTWGTFQSADMTLSTRRGNAMDIASLTIALLRASGIPARYVYGTIEVPAAKFTNWVGDFANVRAAQQYASAGGIPTTVVTAAGKIKSIRMEHVWVEAAVDYIPSRGAVNRSADSWIQMDPSFKQYHYQQGLDVAAITGIDGKALADSFAASGTVNDQQGWIQGLDPSIISNAQQQAQQKLQDYIDNHLTDPTVGDVIGGRRTIVQDLHGLPASLPNKVVVIGDRYAQLPDGLRNFMSFAFGKDIMGEPNDPIRYPWAEVNNAKITLSFRPATDADRKTLESLLPSGQITDLSQLPSSIPAYLIQVVPELKLNGKVVKTGSAMNLGDTLDFVYQVKTPLETRAPYTYSVIAGSYLAIATVGTGVAPAYLKAVKGRLTATQAVLQRQDQSKIAKLTRQDVLGDMFYSGVLGYFAEYSAISHIMALQQRAGQSLAIGYGSYGYEPSVTYLFGIPRSIEAGGAVMNVRVGNYVTTHANDHNKEIQLNEQLGQLSSALEAAVPDQMFTSKSNPGEAVSAVTAIAKAEQEGQKIYHITPANQATTLPNIHLSQPVMDEIRASLAVGKEVFTHTNNVSVPGWTGAGYIIIDPNTGIGAYKIGGGMNGSVFTKKGVADFNNDFSIISLIWDAKMLWNQGLLTVFAKDLLPILEKTLGRVSIFASLVTTVARIVDLSVNCGKEAAMAFGMAMAVLGVLGTVLTIAAGASFGLLGPIVGFFVGYLVSTLLNNIEDDFESSNLCLMRYRRRSFLV